MRDRCMGINISSNMVRLRSRVVQVLLIFTFFALYAFFLFFDHPRIPAATSSSQSSSSSAFNSLEASILPQVFISVKTTGRFHKSRVDLILKTWFKQAPSQTYFFTDVEDKRIDQRSNGHLIQTNCSSSHNRKALCCKMSVELDTFLKSDHKWFCHFDDDNYVHVGRLMELLQSYDPHDDWYLGKPSIRAPLQILDRKTGSKIGFWFATGGAGFCLSRSLVMKMIPSASGGKFITIGEKIRLPDDVTVGYIIEYLLRKPLTVIEQFHSHLEPMKFIKPEALDQQISLSYSKAGDEMNVVVLKNPALDQKQDPTRFLSLHCHLFPDSRASYCNPTIRQSASTNTDHSATAAAAAATSSSSPSSGRRIL